MNIVRADAQVQRLKNLTQSGILICKKALEKRDGNMEFAREYVERHNLAVGMPDEKRFPKWYAHLRKQNGTPQLHIK